MTAQEAVQQHGQKLIGMTLDTEAIGDYPGGPAVVTELLPDPAAPEIVFQVQHPTFGSIGVLDFEQVTILSTLAV